MTQISDDVTRAAVLVGLTSESEPDSRIDALRVFAASCREAGDADAAEAALVEAVDTLERSTGGEGGCTDVGGKAMGLGGDAESIGRVVLARRAYEAGVTALEIDPANPVGGVLKQAIGNTWLVQQGDPKQALESFRAAVRLKRSSDDARSRIISLSSLIDAEARWGEADNCEPLIREGLQLLEEAVEPPAELPEDFAAIAHHLGQVAEVTGWPTLARRTYEVVLDLLEAGFELPPAGVVLHDIGDTWLADGDGHRALDAFRSAVRRKRGVEDDLSVLVTLADLGGAELNWGERPACEGVVEEAVTLLPRVAAAADADPDLIADIARVLAELAAAVGRIELASAARVHESTAGGNSAGQSDQGPALDEGAA